ncbi:hypothetical protein DAPPUDRAFT_223703 [Daphnia pulex]|uniref:UBA domain-containing protein n=1 Tax=Daphnia pulex TaxID=6669 RepID=E9GCZ7_DAPPU|nr:hypothetical protein DAPPUDRAFT_223703 [Daphnia pulex]|eukprot:EFX82641.1 hypothetical protein DAPPUDRAFT_223703 [Daphnia pulex]
MDFNKEHYLARIRQKLQEDGVKLWISPYFVDNKTNVENLQELAMNLSDMLAIPCNAILVMLTTLQSHALEKLASRNQFQQTGMATLRTKIVGGSGAQNKIVISLNESGESLKRRIISEMNHPSTTSGLILDDSKSLQAQKVTNNSQILAIVLSCDPASQKMEERIFQEVEMIKADADLLASQEDENYLRIADQLGNIIALPFEEKKSLAVAMALHEKGRSALKRNQVSLALTLFHEADSKFNACRSELLRAVDNAALLNLDIAWCYLLLGNAADIPDAVVRLNQCEQSLYKTYGAQMERLLTLKGSTGNEAVLFLRLHLLQGVVAFHQGKTLESIKLLNQAKEEIQKLTINDGDLTQLIGLGFTLSDARLSLRACRGDLNAACVYLQRREAEREERLKKEEEEEERDRERRKLGKTANNQWVNLGYLNTIVQMGFERSRAAEGLKQTNNDINRTLEFLQNDFDSFGTDDASRGYFSEESLAQVISMGFSVEKAKEMLEKHNGDVERAVEELASNLGRPDDQPVAGTSRDFEKVEATRKRKEETKKEKAAYKRLAKDIPRTEEDHLDTGLELESEYLHKYLSFLTS